MSVSPHALSGGHSGGPPLAPASCPVRVAVRIKNEPFVAGEQPFLTAHTEENAVSFEGADGTRKKITFDHVFPPVSSQSDVYEAVGPPLVHAVVKRKNAAVVVFGHDGADKTHTMPGDANAIVADASGIIPRALADVFDAIAADRAHEYTVAVSTLAVEIDGEKIVDLLSVDQRELTIRDAGEVGVESLPKIEVSDAAEAVEVVGRAFKRHTTIHANDSEPSSPSHVICTVVLMRKPKNSSDLDIRDVVTLLTFMDFAGSQRIAKTQATAQERKDGVDSNSYLVELSKVIEVLSDKEQSASSRGSKLAHLLKNALGGRSKTVFLACVSANHKQAKETKTTLDHAARVKSVENNAESHVNAAKNPVGTASVEGHLALETKIDSPQRETKRHFTAYETKVHELESQVAAKQDSFKELQRQLELERAAHEAKVRDLEGQVAANQAEIDELLREIQLEREAHETEVSELDSVATVSSESNESEPEPEAPALAAEQPDALLASYRAALMTRHDALGPMPFDTVLAIISSLHRQNQRCAFRLDGAREDGVGHGEDGNALAVVEIVLGALRYHAFDLEPAVRDLFFHWMLRYSTYEHWWAKDPAHATMPWWRTQLLTAYDS